MAAYKILRDLWQQEQIVWYVMHQHKRQPQKAGIDYVWAALAACANCLTLQDGSI